MPKEEIGEIERMLKALGSFVSFNWEKN